MQSRFISRGTELLAALAELHAANLKAREALDIALAHIEAREREWPTREQRAVREGLALANRLGSLIEGTHRSPAARRP